MFLYHPPMHVRKKFQNLKSNKWGWEKSLLEGMIKHTKGKKTILVGNKDKLEVST